MGVNKKILIFLVGISFLNYIGCYSYQQVKKEEFLSSTDKDISLKMNEEDSYLFNEGKYIVKNDTVSGKGKFRQLKYGREILRDYKGKVALKDIKEIRLKKIDVPVTIISVAIAVGLLIFLVKRALDTPWNWGGSLIRNNQ